LVFKFWSGDAMDRSLDDLAILKRFNKSCGLFDKYRELDLDMDFAPYDEPLPLYEKDRDDLAVFKSLLGSKGIDAEQKAETEEEIREIEDELAILKNSILYYAVIDCADRIYSDVLKYGKMMAKEPERFGFTLSGLEVKIHNAGVCKLDLDLEKEMAEKKLYPETTHVEPLFDDALMKYLLE